MSHETTNEPLHILCDFNPPKKGECEHISLIKLFLGYFIDVVSVCGIAVLCFYHPFYDDTFIVGVIIIPIANMVAWAWVFKWKGNVFHQSIWWVTFCICILILSSICLAAIGTLFTNYGSIHAMQQKHISVTNIDEYKHAWAFKFSDGDILINSTECFSDNYNELRLGATALQYYAVAPLVANKRNFSNELIPAFVCVKVDNANCELPQNVNWLQSIRQGTLRYGVPTDVKTRIYAKMNMTYTKQSLQAPVLTWQYISSSFSSSRYQAFNSLIVALVVPSFFFLLPSTYYVYSRCYVNTAYETIPSPRTTGPAE